MCIKLTDEQIKEKAKPTVMSVPEIDTRLCDYAIHFSPEDMAEIRMICQFQAQTSFQAGLDAYLASLAPEEALLTDEEIDNIDFTKEEVDDFMREIADRQDISEAEKPILAMQVVSNRKTAKAQLAKVWHIAKAKIQPKEKRLEGDK